jgi:hypothetical protein
MDGIFLIMSQVNKKTIIAATKEKCKLLAAVQLLETMKHLASMLLRLFLNGWSNPHNISQVNEKTIIAAKKE